MNLLHDLVGYAAATLTTVAFIPQTLHSWRSRDLSGVSLGMYSLFSMGVALWLLFGVLLESWPIIIANTITLALAGSAIPQTAAQVASTPYPIQRSPFRNSESAV